MSETRHSQREILWKCFGLLELQIFAGSIDCYIGLSIIFQAAHHVPKSIFAVNQNVGVHQHQESGFFRRKGMNKLVQGGCFAAFSQIGDTSVKSVTEWMLASMITKNLGRHVRRMIRATVGDADDFTTLAA